jgi:hypothetical protein
VVLTPLDERVRPDLRHGGNDRIVVIDHELASTGNRPKELFPVAGGKSVCSSYPTPLATGIPVDPSTPKAPRYHRYPKWPP